MLNNYNQISSFIWNVCDDVLRGLFKPHEYGDVILPFTVLRRLDCVLEPHKDEVFKIYEKYKTETDPTPIIRNRINTTFFNHSKYDLNRLKSDPQNIYMNFQNYLGGFSDNVVEIIENFQLEKPVEKLNKNNQNINDEVKLRLLGQELNPQTYSICKSDMLITDEDPDSISLGSSLSEDSFQGKRFDYMITNPPFGVSWKSEKEFIENEKQNPYGRFSIGTPRTSDGSLLFLQHMISKMESKGSRIGIVFNGSPLFTGDSGSGESEIRRWIIENDWLECIVSLPDQLFFNTGISTYIWIVNNKKSERRKDRVQLINGSSFFKQMKKSLGNKRKEITEENRNTLLEHYLNFEENEYCKIFPDEFFGYTKVTIEQPLIENGEIVTDKKGRPKPDTQKRDYERVPLLDDIEEYYQREVKPHLPNSWMDRNKDKVGYEINFTKYFYKYKPLRSLEEITQDLLKLEEETDGLMKEIISE